MSDIVGKGEIALLVLAYLKEERFEATYQAFSNECKPFLEQYDLQTLNSSMKSLQLILSEYVALLQEKQAKQNLARALCKNETNRKFVEQTIQSISNLLETYSNFEQTALSSVFNVATSVNKSAATVSAPVPTPTPNTAASALPNDTIKLNKQKANNIAKKAQPAKKQTGTKKTTAATDTSHLPNSVLSMPLVWPGLSLPFFPLNLNTTQISNMLPNQIGPFPSNPVSNTSSFLANTSNINTAGVPSAQSQTKISTTEDNERDCTVPDYQPSTSKSVLPAESAKNNEISIQRNNKNETSNSVTSRQCNQMNTAGTLSVEQAKIPEIAVREPTSFPIPEPHKEPNLPVHKRSNDSAEYAKIQSSTLHSNEDDVKTPQKSLEALKDLTPGTFGSDNLFFTPGSFNSSGNDKTPSSMFDQHTFDASNTPTALPFMIPVNISSLSGSDSREKKRKRISMEKGHDNFENTDFMLYTEDVINHKSTNTSMTPDAESECLPTQKNSPNLRLSLSDSGIFNENENSGKKKFGITQLASEKDVEAFLASLKYQ